MTSDERNVMLATGGLALAAVGAFLPWARIGGRSRSGFNTADTFIVLGRGALPDQIAWVGRWWYLPAFLAMVAWASVFAPGRRAVRAAGVGMLVVGLAMWWVYVWAGEYYDVLDVRYSGPAVATVGLGAIAVACARRRSSVLRTPERKRAARTK